MKTVFVTHCSDWHYLGVGCDNLEASFRHFHPDIPLITWKTAELERHLGTWDWRYCNPRVAIAFAGDYEMVVHIDADSIVVDRLDELLAGDFDVAGVRNNNDRGRAATNNPCTLPHVGVFQYLNAGLVAATRKEFWQDWIDLNDRQKSPMGEQDNLNHLFYGGKYRAKLLDPVEAKLWYGISNTWGQDSYWDSWREMELRNDGLWLAGKKVKVLHQAGGPSPRLSLDQLFVGEVRDYIKRICGKDVA